MGTKVLTVRLNFPLRVPQSEGVGDPIYQYKGKNLPGNTYSAESCTKEECIWLNKRSTVGISQYTEGGGPSAL